ncbi:MAG: hypothetical protein A3I29_04580 [Candidatus Magasanikbacteria bacterium RIFCSPLOWO2_02_FULL_44_11]|uniref:RNA polymerase sigma factor n=2 Tax=Candidatus Magasanikiibacteriota TaxID=1752731 RepID=A0A1F6N9H8_9BACT|nr:MAG: hypothetical protein A3D53_03735 [Candidatus Magasanikbacteria bacterium RIFCSPHIGHO2_02_FULL_45_10]OGH80511.1 MAG: hypothetical protein A3I29_04580 [Candidatus Magasanikbacteria bacterium RIFCSPLOWO2_02_FULL_44_11]
MADEQFAGLSDKELLAEIIKGRGDLFALLYDRHAAAVYRHILFRCAEEAIAEDVSSQAFLQIWEHVREGKKIASFRAFLFQTARNIFIDQTRKREFKNLSLEAIVDEKDKEPVGTDNLLEEAAVNDEVRALQSALATIPEDYREIITLRYLNELSITEIAKVTGKNSGAIYVSLHRGIRLLRKALVDALPFQP